MNFFVVETFKYRPAIGGKLQHKAYCERHSLVERAKVETQKHGIEEIKSLKPVRVELEKLRLLCERIIKREKLKNFQSHSLVRASSVGLPSSSQSLQPHNQPWLPSGSQGKPPLPPTQFRPPSSTQPSQQRSVLPLHHLPIANDQQQQQQISPGQQSQSALSHQQQEHYGQQFIFDQHHTISFTCTL